MVHGVLGSQHLQKCKVDKPSVMSPIGFLKSSFEAQCGGSVLRHLGIVSVSGCDCLVAKTGKELEKWS